MGCGVSRPVLDDHEPIPAGLTPFRRRIEEIRRSRRVNRRSKSHLSSKELLNSCAGDDDQSTYMDPEEEFANDGCRKSVSCGLASIEEDDNNVIPTPLVMERKNKVNHLPESDVAAPTAVDKDKEKEKEKEKEKLSTGAANGIAVAMEKDEEKGRVVTAVEVDKKEEEREHEVKKEEHTKQQEDDETDSDDDADLPNLFAEGYGSDFIGSPSFREYCVVSEEPAKDDGKVGGEKVDGIVRQRKHSTGSEGSFKKEEKEQRKGRRFMSVLPKGGHINMRSLLNRGCYSGPHSHNSHRLTPATTA